MLLFGALAKNMAPMTNADESPYAFLTEHFSLYSIYSLQMLSLQTGLRILKRTFELRNELPNFATKFGILQ